MAITGPIHVSWSGDKIRVGRDGNTPDYLTTEEARRLIEDLRFALGSPHAWEMARGTEGPSDA